MNTVKLGGIVGLALGLLDGASAWLSPSARPTFWVIVVAASLKGLATGLIVGWLAIRIDRVWRIVGVGGLVGAVLSLAAAVPSGAYAEVVGPGIAIGLLLGAIVSRATPGSKSSN